MGSYGWLRPASLWLTKFCFACCNAISVAIGDEPAEYSAWQMSDGEKAALYLAGRALGADEGAVILVDEPETHLTRTASWYG